ncbi:MAG: hypothetical protein Fur0022_35480 [Anaerolineales bacterium]
MITNFQNPLADLNRLMAAAVIDRDFCTLLLSNPIRAIGQGYYGENFHLSTETQAQLGEIQASSLPEFARQVTNGKKFNTAHLGVQYDTSA